MIARRVAFIRSPVERSLSRRHSTASARSSFSTSSPVPQVAGEEPMLAMIFTRASGPNAISKVRPMAA
jgi:hypothetical protein